MKNTKQYYGWVSITVHWVSVLAIFGLFGLGYWMVELSYYDSWYKPAPALHKSIGLSLFLVMIFRVIWRIKQIQPNALESHTDFEKKAGHLTHLILYISIFIIMISGYLISTADGRGIEVFQLFEIPGFGSMIENQEDKAGVLHKYMAYFLMLIVVLHSLAALKHHFIGKDKTLLRMLGHRTPPTLK